MRRRNDQLILFAAMQDVMIRRSRPRREPVLVDAGGNLRLLHDVCEIGGKSVTDVDHRVGALQQRRAQFVPWFRIKMSPDGRIFQIARSQAFETKSGTADLSANVDRIAWFSAGPENCLAGGNTADHGNVDENAIGG